MKLLKYKYIIILLVLLSITSFFLLSQTYEPPTDNWLYNARGAAVLYYNTDDNTFYPVQGDTITGGLNVKIVNPLESNGAIPVNVQDQNSRTFDVYFGQTIGTPTTLTTDAVIDSYSISVTTGHGILVGDKIAMFDAVGQRVYIGEALTSATNLITLDTPLNYSYASASTVVARRTIELNVNGSSIRQIFTIANPINVEVDITRILFQIITDTAPEMTDFGDITNGLTGGIVLRVKNGRNINYWNLKTNGELINLMYDVTVYDALVPGLGSYGLGARLTYAGQDKHGVTIRLAIDDTLQLIVQDDLTSLLSFRMIATGHEVVD